VSQLPIAVSQTRVTNTQTAIARRQSPVAACTTPFSNRSGTKLGMCGSCQPVHGSARCSAFQTNSAGNSESEEISTSGRFHSNRLRNTQGTGDTARGA